MRFDSTRVNELDSTVIYNLASAGWSSTQLHDLDASTLEYLGDEVFHGPYEVDGVAVPSQV